MGLFSRGGTVPADQQGANLNAQRGNMWTNDGYASDSTPDPLNPHPIPWRFTAYREQYRRVFPDGPYDRSWQGVQKENPIAALSVGKMAIPNPLQRQRMHVPTINKTNFTSHSIGAGTALAAYNQQQQQLAAQARPPLLQTILGRLRG